MTVVVERAIVVRYRLEGDSMADIDEAFDRLRGRCAHALYKTRVPIPRDFDPRGPTSCLILDREVTVRPVSIRGNVNVIGRED